jgi:hypothetical protein
MGGEFAIAGIEAIDIQIAINEAAVILLEFRQRFGLAGLQGRDTDQARLCPFSCLWQPATAERYHGRSQQKTKNRKAADARGYEIRGRQVLTLAKSDSRTWPDSDDLGDTPSRQL